MQSRHREHYVNGKVILALAIDEGVNGFIARVVEPSGQDKLSSHVNCTNLDAAQRSADLQLQQAYSHDCGLNHCHEWQDFADWDLPSLPNQWSDVSSSFIRPYFETLSTDGESGNTDSVGFSPDGKYLVSAGVAGRLQFWDVESYQTFLYRYYFGPGAWLDLLPDGRFDASPEGMRYLGFTGREELTYYPAESLVKEFYSPEAVAEVLAKYT